MLEVEAGLMHHDASMTVAPYHIACHPALMCDVLMWCFGVVSRLHGTYRAVLQLVALGGQWPVT
jgi:hypothetical protein